ncbi:MAG: Adenylyl-sulfate kinase [Parcubacteria group bacterium GW2011_GWC2_42_11]|nr:MAG: Adenylyl-sulfate kinase [Parcubacteria group bacterium GW2011_GWC2_42_11]
MKETPKPKRKTVAFDFDAVIATYSGFVGKEYAEEPISETVKAIKILKEKGFTILIHSTRGDEFLKKYCEKYDIPYDHINHRPDKFGDNPGKPIAFVYVDDRSLRFTGQKAEVLVEEIVNFKPYWQE